MPRTYKRGNYKPKSELLQHLCSTHLNDPDYMLFQTALELTGAYGPNFMREALRQYAEAVIAMHNVKEANEFFGSLSDMENK